MRLRTPGSLLVPLILCCGASACHRLPTPPRSTAVSTPLVAVLSEHGHGRVSIHVPAGVMEPDTKKMPGPYVDEQAELSRRRLRESVKDLAEMIHRIAGVDVPVRTKPPDASAEMPILIDRFAEERFGKPTEHTVMGQGFRVVVTPSAIGLAGDAPLGTSYAIYELLHRLGCRWYMPGELGEVVPRNETLTIAPFDISEAPFTYYRDVWYADEAYHRRNRTGGLLLNAGHGLEGNVSAKQRQEHPEWRATVNGKPHPSRLNWSNPGVANAIASSILAQLDRRVVPSVSLSPDDGLEFSESPEDLAIDAGDWNVATNNLSLTDRLMVLTNRVATQVTQKYPDVLFGLLAYGPVSRTPIRERVHPNVIPQIAPIVYCRAQPFTDDRCPGSEELRALIVGWEKSARMVSYYAYAYNLSEPSAPNPMVGKWAAEVPFLLAHNVRFWQPETFPNFETTAPALYLGLRLAFDPREKPLEIVDEMYTLLYGPAAPAMKRFFSVIDDAWVKTPEYCGGERGYLRRFPEPVLQQGRAAINEALARAQTPLEHRRVEMQDASLRQFEAYMVMRRAWAQGDFADLEGGASRWRARASNLAEGYKTSFAFGWAAWATESIQARYFRQFVEPSYVDAARIASGFELLTRPPLKLSWRTDKEGKGEAEGWSAIGHDDQGWPSTDPAVDSWSSLGLHTYMGKIWYRARVRLPRAISGKRTYLWLGGLDGSARVWANGIAGRAAWEGTTSSVVETFARPVTFDVTDGINAGADEVTIAILAERKDLNELGSGGITGPVVVYRDR